MRLGKGWKDRRNHIADLAGNLSPEIVLERFKDAGRAFWSSPKEIRPNKLPENNRKIPLLQVRSGRIFFHRFERQVLQSRIITLSGTCEASDIPAIHHSLR